MKIPALAIAAAFAGGILLGRAGSFPSFLLGRGVLFGSFAVALLLLIGSLLLAARGHVWAEARRAQR